MDPQTQQIIAQLQQQLQQQQAQLQQQQALLAQQSQDQQALYARQQSAAASASSSSAGGAGSSPFGASGRPLVKPKPPSTFLASDKTGELDQWEREMRYQFAAYGPALASEEARISFAVSYLGAVPLQWWGADPSHRQVQTWAEFVDLLGARFRPVQAAKQARTELFKIKQSASQSAGAYASAFQQLLVSLPDMHVDDQVFLFVRGLLPSLKRRVGDKDFATLSAAINAAVQSEGLYGVQVADESSASSSSASNDSMMDVNAISESGEQSRASKSLEAFAYGRLAAQLVEAQGQLYALQHQGRQDRRPGAPSQKNDPYWVPGLSRQQVADRRAAGQCLRC
ncbi:MAG: hypothetical protein P4L10_13635, partial [Acidobacteriaceae bacterium]|nr:hypothetical protein [Acidobacteriaceae bacterium]